jgi:hypothetical protein
VAHDGAHGLDLFREPLPGVRIFDWLLLQQTHDVLLRSARPASPCDRQPYG